MTAAGTTSGRQLSPQQRQKIAAMGRRAASHLHAIMRNVKMYDPDNDIFAQPLELLTQSINDVIAADGKFDLQAIGTMLALNGVVVPVDFSALENIRHLTDTFKDRGMGGFTVDKPVSTEDVKKMMRVFSQPASADLDEEEKLKGMVSIRLGKYRLIQKKVHDLTDAEIDKTKKIDRDKYALTVYARAVTYLRRVLEAVEGGGELPRPAAAARIVRDFVDLARDHKQHFMGLSGSRSSKEYLAYHSVNTCLLSIVIGAELGMEREQLYDLGRAALLHDIGMSRADPAVLERQGAISTDERERVRQSPLVAARVLMRTRPLDTSVLRGIVAAHEAKRPFARAVAAADGSVKSEPTPNLGLFGRVIRVASTFDALTSARPYRDAFTPANAIAIMREQMRFDFDPAILSVLVGVMAHAVTFKSGQSTIEIFK